MNQTARHILIGVDPDNPEHVRHVQEICNELANDLPWRRLGIGADRLATGMLQPDPGASRCMITNDGKPAGVLRVRAPWLFGIYIELLGLRSTQRSKGLGRQVIAELENMARTRKHRNIWLCVSAFNNEAQAFYNRQGFSSVGELTGLIVPAEDEILMRKQL